MNIERLLKMLDIDKPKNNVKAVKIQFDNFTRGATVASGGLCCEEKIV